MYLMNVPAHVHGGKRHLRINKGNSVMKALVPTGLARAIALSKIAIPMPNHLVKRLEISMSSIGIWSIDNVEEIRTS